MMKIGLFVIIITFRHVAAHCNNPLMWNYEYQHLAKQECQCAVFVLIFLFPNHRVLDMRMFMVETMRRCSPNAGEADSPSWAIPSHKGRTNSTRWFASVERGMEWRQISNSDVYLSQLRGISSPHLWLVRCVLCGGDYRSSLQPPLVSVIVKVRAERQT